MLDIKLSALKQNIKYDPSTIQKSYEKLNQLRKHDEHLKALYAQKGLPKPEIMA